MFTLLCCADLAGNKVNLEIALETFPATLRCLESDIARIFSREVEESGTGEHRTNVAEPFQVMSVVIYDDVLLRWTKLKSLAQLHEYDQLYVFQPQTQWHVDLQKELPPPRPPARSRASSLTGTSGALASLHVNGRASSPWPRSGLSTRVSAAADVDTSHSPVPSRSPARAQLEEHRREEERLAHRLATLRRERELLEREAQREEEEERRRRSLETYRLLKCKEEEIWSQRDALARAEEEFRQFLAEKQRLMGQSPTP
ncbi:conserved hypothetical protein [Leishmania infantum JPCM5]|uniref:BILBO1 N-terminal domain-containing protein n=2 Tax=Leishmania infantum TaxID=5671 RepID=A4ICK5_LEIIN|nr:conserved hypothetical protein [Leishmania infantum JPCM5]CAC9549494.1 hypothetical_protein_-_conserved [Leishmania infantum]CAM72583.1 conserved hypothetical protein [Leishmania infantum JPCM5]SUZ46508.1 hypothetical_protein_-_conserved [Leishmania infantum]|eukprot:XP_001469474.1 conserved hypothetical protein [Leishmania infantum JPCM5]